MLSLVLGNLHVPYRAIDLPIKFKELLEKNQGKINKIYICSTAEDPIMTMNTTNSDLLQFLHDQVCSDIELVGSVVTNPEVQGNKYEQPLATKTKKTDNGLSVYNINGFRVAFVSQIPVVPKDDVLALINMSRQTRSDILIWSGKHEVEAYSLEGVLFLSPGTATGAFSIESGMYEEEQEEAEDIIEEKEEEPVESKDTTEVKDVDSKSVPASEGVEDEDKEKQNNEEVSAVDDKAKTDDEAKDVTTKEEPKKETFAIHKTLNVEPSFILLDIPESKIEGEDVTCTVYIYSLDGESQEIAIDNIEFKKT